MAASSDYDFNRYFHSTDIVTAGTSRDLLSLRQSSGFYTGGAHPNSFTKAHYWDRIAARRIEAADLFVGDALDRMVSARFCPRLNEQRVERRGGLFGDGTFDECPAPAELSVIAVDRDGNLLFDGFTVIADPYVAGPYAEGRYEIEIPVDTALIADLKPAYRGSFEVSGQ